METGKRIKEVRTTLKLTQLAFADRLGLKRNTVGGYEIGAVVPSDRTILDICREFNVSKDWLRNGEGSMFAEKSPNEEISSFMGDILNGNPDFRQRFISVLARMTPDEWRILENKVLELAARIKNPDH